MFVLAASKHPGFIICLALDLAASLPSWRQDDVVVDFTSCSFDSNCSSNADNAEQRSKTLPTTEWIGKAPAEFETLFYDASDKIIRKLFGARYYLHRGIHTRAGLF